MFEVTNYRIKDSNAKDFVMTEYEIVDNIYETITTTYIRDNMKQKTILYRAEV